MAHKNDVAKVQELFKQAAAAEEVIVDDTIVEDTIVEDEVIVDTINEDEEIIDEDDDDEEIIDGVTPQPDDEPYTISSLADAIEIDASELYDVLIPLDGDNPPISIGEIKNKVQDLARDNLALETKVSEQQTLIDQGGQQSQQASQISQFELQARIEIQTIENEFKAMNWEEEEAYDAGSAALKRQKLEERYRAAQGMAQQAQQAQQMEHQKYLQGAHTRMMELIPTWKDPEIAKTDKIAMNDLMLGAGYTQQIIDHLDDPIAMSLLRELSILRAEKANASKVLETAKRKVPKVLKGTGQFAAKKKNVSAELVKKAKQTGKRQDEFAAVKALFKNSNSK